MLSAEATATVRATLPVVGGAIGEITPRFYGRLFAAHPELERDLFNRGNQASGAQQQALAGSIAAFAVALLEHPDTRPDVMLSRIAHKHASLGVRAEHYPIVHEHLFAAIVDVLGEAVTPEVAAAWTEVYWLMANALIAIEARLYQESGVPAGDVWKDYQVVSRRNETEQVVTFGVRPADGSELPAQRPGQYVSVQVELPDGAHQIRQYSLSGQAEGELRFSVKRDGEVSNFLHDQVQVSDKVRVSMPFGDVYLDEASDSPVVLVSAGIGCTPMIGILGHLAAADSKRRVISVHADRSPAEHAFRGELAELTAQLPDAAAHVWYEAPEGDWPADRTGRIDLGTVELPTDATAYLCGPLPFLRAAREQLLTAGLPASAIHYEVFGPDLWLAGA